MSKLTNGIDDGGIWLTCAELARRKNVSRAAITKRADQLEAAGKITTRREGRTRLIELVEYDRAVGEVGDSYREQSAATRRQLDDGSRSPALRDAQTERAQYEAKLKALDLAERTSQLVPMRGSHGVEAAMVRAGSQIVKALDQPLIRLSEIEEAARGDMAKLRRVIKDIIFQQRQAIGESLRMMKDEAERETGNGYELDVVGVD